MIALLRRLVGFLALFAVSGAAFAALQVDALNLDLQTNGFVVAVARQPNGAIVFGGQFTKVNGVARSNIARLKPDGTLDTAWAPTLSGQVAAIAADNSAVYIAGQFYTVNGVSRATLAKLSATDAALDLAFNPAPNNAPASLTLDGAGNLLVTGGFTQISGQGHNYLAKLDAASGTAASAWNPVVDGAVNWTARSGDTFYIGGYFNNAGGVAHKYLSRVSIATGAVDTAWTPAPDSYVTAIAADGAGSVYIGGFFANAGGLSRTKLAKLSASTGAADANWDPAPNDVVRSLVADATRVYVGGDFTVIAGASLAHVAKLDAASIGTADGAWKPNPDQTVYALAANGSNGVIAVGGFSQVYGGRCLGMVNLNVGLGYSSSATTTTPGSVGAFARQSDGGIVMGGDFYFAAGFPFDHLLRLAPNGLLDTTWKPNVDGGVSSIVSIGTSIFIAGNFQHVGGVLRQGLAKLDAAGVLDTNWNPAPDSTGIDRLVTEGTTAIYAQGNFQHIGGQARAYVAKLSPSGGGLADAAWNPQPGSSVYAVAPDGAGSVYLGGFFTQMGGMPRTYLAKVSASTGALDANWKPMPNSFVSTILADAGAVYVGGAFTQVNSLAHLGVAKLAPSGNGAPDAAFSASMTNGVYALARADDGLLIGGQGAVDGQASNSSFGKVNYANGALIDLADFDGPVSAMLAAPGSLIYVGGTFADANNQPHQGFAVLKGDAIFAAGFQ